MKRNATGAAPVASKSTSMVKGCDGAHALVEATTAGLELAARARERSSAATAARRELRTEFLVGAGFVVAAAAAWVVLDGAAASPALTAWLVLICALLVRVEFEVGEGCTRPVQLVLAPMLVLLPAGAVPLAVGVAHVAAQLPGVLRRTAPRRRLLFATADSWFSLAPAVIVGVVGLPGQWTACAALVALVTVAQFAVDFAVSAVRACLGAGERLRALLVPFAWVWLVDLLMIPIGVLAAVVGAGAPVAVGGVSRWRPCSPCSPASERAGSTTQWRSSTSRRRRATASSRSCGTRRT